MTNKKSYEFCPLRKQGLLGLDGLEDQAFRCEDQWTFPSRVSKKCYGLCDYTGDKFKKCSYFKRNEIRNEPRKDFSNSTYMGCSAGAMG